MEFASMMNMQEDSIISGQIILIGTVVAENYHPKVAKGCKCAMISVVDCDKLAETGHLYDYMLDEGLNAGALLDATLGQYGWIDIKVRNALPIANKDDGWEPEVAALIKAARKIGVAHMVFEPENERPLVVH